MDRLKGYRIYTGLDVGRIRILKGSDFLEYWILCCVLLRVDNTKMRHVGAEKNRYGCICGVEGAAEGCRGNTTKEDHWSHMVLDIRRLPMSLLTETKYNAPLFSPSMEQTEPA